MHTALVLAVITLILGQVLIKVIVEPAQVARRTIAEIARALIYYQNVYADPGNRHSAKIESEAHTALRNLASELAVGNYMIPSYTLIARLFALPSHEDCEKARSELIALSNNVYSENKARREIGTSTMQNIRHLLKINDT